MRHVLGFIAVIGLVCSTIAAGAEKPAASEPPKDGPGDPKITYEMVRKQPSTYRGKRVVWPASAQSGSGKQALCAVNPDAKDARQYLMYAVEFASEKAMTDVFFAGKGQMTATVSGEIEVSYEVAGPGGEGKQTKKEKVPLLVHPTFAPDKK